MRGYGSSFRTARESRAEELKKLAQMQKMWALRKPVLDAHILSLQKRIQELEQEIDGIMMEKMSASMPVRSISPRFPSEK